MNNHELRREYVLDQALAQGLLGDVLDAGERPGEAFAAFVAANQTLRPLYA